MKKQNWLIVLLLVWCWLLSVPAFSQAISADKQSQRERPRGQRAGKGRQPSPSVRLPRAFGIQAFEMQFSSQVVKGVPFTATIETEHRQTLADGTVLSRKNSGAVWRDSAGRVRREQTFASIGPFDTSAEPLRVVFINDPVKGEAYVLDPLAHTARRLKSSQGGAELRSEAATDQQDGFAELGLQTIEGIEAEGRRKVTTINIGRFGNNRPLEVINERWKARELQVELKTYRRDPRFGEHSFQLTNIQRVEPPASLFVIPADYSLLDENQPKRPPRRMKREPGRKPW